MIGLVLALVGFLVLLYFSGLFSGSETAFFSLSRVDLGQLDEKSRIRRLMEEPDRLLIGVLLGNTLVNVALGSLGAVFALELSRRAGYSENVTIAFEVGVVTLVILIFGEMAPKMYAMQRNLAFARRSGAILLVILGVLRWPVQAINALLTRLGGPLSEDERPFVTAEELRTIVAVSEQRGTLEEEERDLIDSVMEFGDTVVREVMVPRVDIEGLEDTATVAEALVRVKELGYSRLPIYRGDVDHIVGVLYAKDLLRVDSAAFAERRIGDLVRPAAFTPESKNADDLLRDLQRDRIHIAIVVDEYGGTAGLVTLEDLIEEIVGEIRDEYDEEEPLVRVINKSTIVADGMVRLEELVEEFGVEVREEGIETLGGYLMDAFGRIPSEGEKLERDGLEFTVEAVDERRVSTVRIVRVTDEESSGGDDEGGAA